MVPHVGRWQLLLVVTIVAFGVDANGFQLMRLMKKISKMRHLGFGFRGLSLSSAFRYTFVWDVLFIFASVDHIE
ncbi:hypothetical protein B296_00008738 [Ensete ventricosum]|uniref:Uncharacterized protein n=1 Tax=Ensete ventricosum TaxID=4639 RepID=A0A426ZDQ0_ENSVE|nr:hypothetical protein B296_00008738 [Ensete ventricosum]